MSTCTKCFVFTEECQICELETKNRELEKHNDMLAHQLKYAETIITEVQADKFKSREGLSVAVEALEFYGKKESYEPWTEAYSEYTDYGRDYMCAIDCIQEDDTEKIMETLSLSKKEVHEWYGGKRARLALAAIKGASNE